MDRLREFLEAVRTQGMATGRFRGLLHLLVGRHIQLADGTLVSDGMTWRAVAQTLKKYRWDKEAVGELGLSPEDLPPRDREKYWYLAITRANLSSAEATAQANALAEELLSLGYIVGPGPSQDKQSDEKRS
jgi:hypothetical protein